MAPAESAPDLLESKVAAGGRQGRVGRVAGPDLAGDGFREATGGVGRQRQRPNMAGDEARRRRNEVR